MRNEERQAISQAMCEQEYEQRDVGQAMREQEYKQGDMMSLPGILSGENNMTQSQTRKHYYITSGNPVR